MVVKPSVFRSLPAQMVIRVEQRYLDTTHDRCLIAESDFLNFFRFFVDYSVPSIVPSKFAR
jgi:hypothetical protein